MAEAGRIRTGMLREDIKIIPPGRHGAYTMIFDPVSEVYFKISPIAAQVIAKLDRDYDLEEFHAKLKRLGIFISIEELNELIFFIAGNNLAVPEYGKYERKREQMAKLKKVPWLLKLTSFYMFIKLPPWHPRRFFEKISPYVSFLASKPMIWIYLIPAILGYLLALRNFGEVRDAFWASLSWAGLVKYFFAIIMLKFIHESSHALAAMRFKCPVREIGVSIIFLYPRLFTNTTDSWRLPRHQRLLIDSAGLIGEVICGGIAALCWCYLSPGTAKSTMFYIFAVSTMSTLLVNGNPLIRFDGYYILCDLLNTENLMQRSTEYIKQFWRCYFFQVVPPPVDERPWLMGIFGISAFIYRVLLYTSIILIVYNQFIQVKAVAALMLYSVGLLPIIKEAKSIRAMSKRAGGKVNWTFSLITLGVVIAVLFLPLSWNVVLPGEVKASRSRLVTVNESGYLASKWPEVAVPCKKGDLIADLESPLMDLQIQRVDSALQEDSVLVDLQQSDKSTFGDSLLTLQKMDGNRKLRSEMLRRRKQRQIRAEVNGVFVPALFNLSPGSYMPNGLVIGEIVSNSRVIHAYATEQEVKVLKKGQHVSVTLPDSPAKISGKIKEIDPIPAKIKNSTLLQMYGGELAVFPDETKPGEFYSAQALYRLEIKPEKEVPEVFLPGRSVRARVYRRDILANEIWSFLVTAFRREM